jgi:lipopolysaccharide biosynthesis glycosyltransferase
VRGSRVEVACAIDGGYLPHCAAMLHSLIAHTPSPLSVHVLVPPGFSHEARRTLTSWLEDEGASSTIQEVEDQRLSGVQEHFSPVIWYRTLLPELLPGIDRVIHLDCDVLITDTLEPLWQVDLQGNSVAAVTNPPLTLEWMERHCRALGIPSVEDYFNAGVMVLDLEELRARNMSDRILDYGRTNIDEARAQAVDENSSREVFVYTMEHPERLLFPDQDSMNALLWDSRLKLHPRWNHQRLFARSKVRTDGLSEDVIAEAREHPAIEHFEGPGHSKPWHEDADPEMRGLYERHLRQTPWAHASPPAASA